MCVYMLCSLPPSLPAQPCSDYRSQSHLSSLPTLIRACLCVCRYNVNRSSLQVMVNEFKRGLTLVRGSPTGLHGVINHAAHLSCSFDQLCVPYTSEHSSSWVIGLCLFGRTECVQFITSKSMQHVDPLGPDCYIFVCSSLPMSRWRRSSVRLLMSRTGAPCLCPPSFSRPTATTWPLTSFRRTQGCDFCHVHCVLLRNFVSLDAL